MEEFQTDGSFHSLPPRLVPKSAGEHAHRPPPPPPPHRPRHRALSGYQGGGLDGGGPARTHACATGKIGGNPPRFPPVPASHGAGSVLSRSPPVAFRSPPVPARCRLGPRRCMLGSGSIPACHGASSIPARCWLGQRRCLLHSDAGLVPARAGSVPAGAGSVLARCRLGSRLSVSVGACSAPTSLGSVSVHFLFTQIE